MDPLDKSRLEAAEGYLASAIDLITQVVQRLPEKQRGSLLESRSSMMAGKGKLFQILMGQ